MIKILKDNGVKFAAVDILKKEELVSLIKAQFDY